MKRKTAQQRMTIQVDQREKLPYTFAGMASELIVRVEPAYLPTGDYLLAEPGDGRTVVVERKSLADLYSTLGSHRERFEAEFERLAAFRYAALVIEAEWSQILNPLKFLNHYTQLNPRSVHSTLLAWSQRYGVHVWTYPGRETAERATFRLLERWARDVHDGKRVAAQEVPT